MKTTYQLRIIGASGMYTEGGHAISTNLARLIPGHMKTPKSIVGLYACTWDVDDGREYIRSSVLVDAEEYPGQWTIGVKGGDGYREGK